MQFCHLYVLQCVHQQKLVYFEEVGKVMRTKDLNMLRVVNCLIEKGSLPLTGSNSIYEYFNINKIDGQGYDSSNSVFDMRTLRRYVNELLKNGLLEENNGVYSISKKYFNSTDIVVNDEFKMLLQALLESGEYEISKQLQTYISEKQYLQEGLVEKYQRTVREPLKILDATEETIVNINEAIKSKTEIAFEYKQKQYFVTPICYLISRNGLNIYLYAVKRNKLQPPFELKYIKWIKNTGVRKIDNSKEFYDIVNSAWDVDLQEKVHLKLAVRENRIDTAEVKKQLERSMKCHTKNNIVYFEGDIVGINDFKTWIREHITTCIVVEPQSLRTEIINSLEASRMRYEEDINV